jgi:hypothetical protein
MRKKDKGELKGRSGKLIEVGEYRRWEEDLKEREETSREEGELRGERTLREKGGNKTTEEITKNLEMRKGEVGWEI